MATVIYRAPEGDSDAVSMGGHRFYDGHPVEVADPAKIAMFKANRYFDVADIEIEAVEATDAAETDAPKRRGRPPKVTVTEEEGGE